MELPGGLTGVAGLEVLRAFDADRLFQIADEVSAEFRLGKAAVLTTKEVRRVYMQNAFNG